jgi:hypothetical protein
MLGTVSIRDWEFKGNKIKNGKNYGVSCKMKEASVVCIQA